MVELIFCEVLLFENGDEARLLLLLLFENGDEERLLLLLLLFENVEVGLSIIPISLKLISFSIPVLDN